MSLLYFPVWQVLLPSSVEEGVKERGQAGGSGDILSIPVCGLWLAHISSIPRKAALPSLTWLVSIQKASQVVSALYAIPVLKVPGDDLS